MPFKPFERVALWTGTGFCGLSAVCFAVNAGATLLEHPERNGELYGMATAAAIFAFVTSRLLDVIRDRDAAAEQAIAPPRPNAALPPGAPTWYGSTATASEPGVALPAPVRVERDCPYCAEPILVAAKICKHCRSDVSAA